MSLLAINVYPLEVLEETDDSDKEHVVCLCTPNVTFCGAFDDGEILGPVSDYDEDICPDCLINCCIRCGCRNEDPCDMCSAAQ